MAKAKRNDDGTFAPGASGNPGGRPLEYHGFKRKCREWMGSEGWEELTEIARDKENRHRLDAIRLLCEYAYGAPSKKPLITSTEWEEMISCT